MTTTGVAVGLGESVGFNVYMGNKLIIDMAEKSKIIRYSIIGFTFFFVASVYSIIANYNEEKLQFSGIIEKVTYNEKKTPIILIKEKTYVVSTHDWRFNEKLEPGDSLFKIKNSKVYKLFKHKTKEVIFSNDK